jgi:hypothetical protein
MRLVDHPSQHFGRAVIGVADQALRLETKPLGYLMPNLSIR